MKRWPWLELRIGPWQWPTIHRNPMEDAVSLIIGPLRCKLVHSDMDAEFKQAIRKFKADDTFNP